MDHDQNFKNLILDYPIQALASFAAAEAAAIDGSARIVPVRQEQLNELQRYRPEYPEEAEQMSSFAERFREQGMQQGEALILVRLIERKFGALTPELRRRIEDVDSETLLRWSERLLTAGSVEEVLH